MTHRNQKKNYRVKIVKKIIILYKTLPSKELVSHSSSSISSNNIYNNRMENLVLIIILIVF
jgi:hypothetical protein